MMRVGVQLTASSNVLVHWEGRSKVRSTYRTIHEGDCTGNPGDKPKGR